jgi:hypothetical protein
MTRFCQVVAQCRLLKIARSTLYYRPAPVDPDDVAVMRRFTKIENDTKLLGSRDEPDAGKLYHPMVFGLFDRVECEQDSQQMLGIHDEIFENFKKNLRAHRNEDQISMTHWTRRRNEIVRDAFVGCRFDFLRWPSLAEISPADSAEEAYPADSGRHYI